MSKEQHDYFQQFVEKEKSRELMIEAVQSGTIVDSWKKVVAVAAFLAIVGAGIWLYKTQSLKAAVTAIRTYQASLKKVKEKNQQPVDSEPDSAAAEKQEVAVGISNSEDNVAALPKRQPASMTIPVNHEDQEAPHAPDLLVGAPGAPVYRQINKIPPAYARDKQEFPDFP